ncbi:response regulator [Candidatus Woesearchaeota archaeon]|jgi:DNA-binding response OmpR family regulator|nr:response regulator [Candidatus Woesearchaeota archaeon]
MAKKKSVLIIEDEENIANAQKMILDEEFNVSVAYDGETGLEKIKKLRPDLIVLDLMLPNRGGYDVCFSMRQDPELKDIKVLMVTALNQPVDKNKGVMVGTDEYLTKPFEPEQLLSAVRKLLS